LAFTEKKWELKQALGAKNGVPAYLTGDIREEGGEKNGDRTDFRERPKNK